MTMNTTTLSRELEHDRLLNIGELAAALKVSRSFVKRMKGRGFSMPLGRASVAMANKFICDLAKADQRR